MKLMNAAPHTQVQHFTVDGDDSQPVTRKLILEPGEVRDLDDELWDQMESDTRIQKAINDRRLIADVEPASKRHTDEVHGIVNNRLSPRFITELSKTARNTDIEDRGTDGLDIIGQASQQQAEKFRLKEQRG